MKNIFEKPELQVIKLTENDVITTSPTDPTEPTTFGKDVWTPWLEL